MGQRARQVAVFDVEVQVLVIAAADGLDEVGEMGLVLAAAPLAQFVAVVVEGHAGRVIGADDVTFGSVPDVGRAVERAVPSVRT